MFGLFADAVVSSNGRRRKLEDKSDCLLSSVLGGTIQCACNAEVQMKFLFFFFRMNCCCGSAWKDHGQEKLQPIRNIGEGRYLATCRKSIRFSRFGAAHHRCHASVVIELNHSHHYYRYYYYYYYYHYYYHD